MISSLAWRAPALFKALNIAIRSLGVAPMALRALANSETVTARETGISCSIDPTEQGTRSLREYLQQQKRFTPDVVDTWIWYKTTNEVDALRLRPHPYEFCLYFDI